MQHGHELTALREKLFWSAAMLADSLGVSRATIWRWEKCNTLPTSCLLRLRRWAKANAKRQPHEPRIGLTKNTRRGRPSTERF